MRLAVVASLLLSAVSFPLSAFSQAYYTPGSGARYQGSADQPQLATEPTGETANGKPILAPEVVLNGTASTAPASIIPAAFSSSASVTRPADTSAYTAGDVVSDSTSAPTVLTFASIGPSGGRVLITSADIRIDVSAVPSGMGIFRLHLYDAAPTAINDNAAYNLPSGDRAKYLGYLDITAPGDLGDTLYGTLDTVRKQVKLAAASTSIYGILESRGAYTPTSAAVKTIRIRSVQLSTQ